MANTKFSNDAVTLTPAQRARLVDYVRYVIDNDGLDLDFLGDDAAAIKETVEALNALDGGNRNPNDHLPDHLRDDLEGG